MADVGIDYGVIADQGAQVGVSYSAELRQLGSDVFDIGKDAAFGAAIGGAIGSAVGPPIGTAVGGAIGYWVGVIVGAVQTIEDLVSDIGGLFHKSCTITIDGIDGDCADYPKGVKEAIDWLGRSDDGTPNWLKVHSFTPSQYAEQMHILEQDFADWYAGLGDDYKSRIDSSKAAGYLKRLPGAQSILRTVQLTLASMLAAGTPELLPLYRVTFPSYFPALTVDDLAGIFLKAQIGHDVLLAQAVAWAQDEYRTTYRLDPESIHRPTADAIHAAFPALLPIDVTKVWNARRPGDAPSGAIVGDTGMQNWFGGGGANWGALNQRPPAQLAATVADTRRVYETFLPEDKAKIHALARGVCKVTMHGAGDFTWPEIGTTDEFGGPCDPHKLYPQGMLLKLYAEAKDHKIAAVRGAEVALGRSQKIKIVAGVAAGLGAVAVGAVAFLRMRRRKGRR